MFIAIVFVILNSYRHFAFQWQSILNVLQLGSLATIFSAIAAFGVIAQLLNVPLVYTTIDPKLKTDPVGILLSPNSENDINFFIYNCSKVTATDIIIKARFPSQIRVINIKTPTWSNITDNGQGFEIHLDTDRSYNPLHPFMFFSFTVTVRTSHLPGPHAIIVYTITRNTPIVPHTFIIATNPLHLEGINLRELIRKNHMPIVQTMDKYFLIQKVFTLILLNLGIVPFLPHYFYPLIIVLNIFLYFVALKKY